MAVLAMPFQRQLSLLLIGESFSRLADVAGASGTPRRAGGDADGNDDSITVQDLVGGQDNVMLLDVSTEEVTVWMFYGA